MAVRLTKTESSTHVTPDSARVVYRVTVEFKTEADANDIARAFENVLAPRFTRDEAIAIVKAAIPLSPWADVTGPSIEMVRGIRLALEALAAAGAFVDSDPCPWCAANREVTPDPGSACETCDGSGRLRAMSDKLDAAGIK